LRRIFWTFLRTVFWKYVGSGRINSKFGAEFGSELSTITSTIAAIGCIIFIRIFAGWVETKYFMFAYFFVNFYNAAGIAVYFFMWTLSNVCRLHRTTLLYRWNYKITEKLYRILIEFSVDFNWNFGWFNRNFDWF